MDIQILDVVRIAQDVGNNILLPNWGNVSRLTKTDGSPVTIVDQQASDFIIEALKSLMPEIPVVSEEASNNDNLSAMEKPWRWVVDPLDGTATYLSGPKLGKEAGFGVHIALVNEGLPVKGVCYFPAQEKVYYTGDDGKAYQQTHDEKPKVISVSKEIRNPKLRAAVPWKLDKRPKDIYGLSYEPVPAVGGEEVCRVACGEADIIWHNRPDKNQPISEREVFSHWDVAAAHAVLKKAGGELYEMATGDAVSYSNQDFSIPPCAGAHPSILKVVGIG